MNIRKTVPKFAAPSRSRPLRGASSSTLLVVLLLLVLGGGLVAWIVLGGGAAPPAAPKPVPEAEPPAPPKEPDPAVVEATGPPVDSEAWKQKMKEASRVPVQGAAKRTANDSETATLEGDVVDADTKQPVYFAWLYLIPPERGDVVEAQKGWTPNRFRNGHFRIDRQPVGTYNVLCESREHDAWTGTIKVPYDGHFKILLKKGTAVEGFVRDVNQTPLEGIDVGLEVDLTRIDRGFDPPMQRIVKTDKLGHYAFNKLPPGTYGLQASLMSDVLATEREFRVDPRATIQRDFTLPRLGTIKVTVKNVADQPLARARVSLVQERDGRERPVRSSYSDIKGIARVEFIREGSYKLRVQVQGFETYEDQVTVVAGEEFRELPIQLRVAQKSGN